MSRNSHTATKQHPGDIRDPKLPIVALAQNMDGPRHYPWHQHYRAQLSYASEGVMRVSTTEGTWLVVPQQAVWIPAGTEHEVFAKGPIATMVLLGRMLEATMPEIPPPVA